MSLFLTPAARRHYLRRCIRISLLKRWPLVAGLTVAALGLGVLITASWIMGTVTALLAVLLTSAGVAVSSVQRHRHDL
ncbi:hypothetical protein E7T09_20075 [Deinococcus sp. KSM4-11]|uniref:hypothetical protein n=1 Tax=Deinococcus sp. KSM4-11 TaxID=2568654 RepID=UPI0010A41E79|nr:hypothetical protein [Deinococcus sp. KSM4-11]THF84317.1 hypothetical protein E7T09_20075 [Deinococcus sp. KSM4-11]